CQGKGGGDRGARVEADLFTDYSTQPIRKRFGTRSPRSPSREGNAVSFETDLAVQSSAMTLSPLVKFGTSTWTYEGWQGQVYHKPYAKTAVARECPGPQPDKIFKVNERLVGEC